MRSYQAVGEARKLELFSEPSKTIENVVLLYSRSPSVRDYEFVTGLALGSGFWMPNEFDFQNQLTFWWNLTRFCTHLHNLGLEVAYAPQETLQFLR